MSKAEEARKLFDGGANCAQAVLTPFAAELGLDRESALRLASGFGGGVGRMREVCGAVSAMVMIHSIRHGNADIADKAAKDAVYAKVQHLAGRFKAEAGSIICRELLAGNASAANTAPVSEARTAGYYQQRPCGRLVELAARIMEEEESL